MTLTIEQKLLARSARDEITGCLRWLGAHNPKGYGQVTVDGRARPVHRVAHELWIGPIPDGYEVDHVVSRGCAHRDCIEPGHLEAVTHQENLRRGQTTLAGLNLRKSHCKHGHEFTPENTYTLSGGGRECIECRRTASRERLILEGTSACPDCGLKMRMRNVSRHRRNMHGAGGES